MQLVTLFVRYDQEKYPNSYHYLKKYLQFITIPNKVIIIDNKIETPYFETLGDGTTVINGDNTLWEFSAWQRGVEYLKENNVKYDAILFVNDSFLAPGHNQNVEIMNDGSAIECVKDNSMMGGLCACYMQNSELNGYKFDDFIRSNVFILPKKAIEGLKTIYSVDVEFINRCISEKPTFPYFKNNAPVCDKVKKAIVEVLTKHWHSKFKLEDNWELFRMKTLALFNEYLLTQRVRAIK